MNKLTKPGIFSMTIFLIGFAPFSGTAQFLNVQIDVDPEVETLVERPLDFGRIITNSGLQQIEAGSPYMGIFKIRALRTQRLFLSIDADNELSSEDEAVQSTLPLEIQASYTNNGLDDYNTSRPITNTMEAIIIEGPPFNPQATWSSAYVFIYGNLHIGDVSAGNYSGNITLSVIYE